MYECAERVMQLAQAPFNQGRIEDTHGMGFYGSDCGDWVRM
jgi:NifU-like protein involved in Fe-S cluster formation